MAAARPGLPGCGYSDTPDDFAYTLDGYVDFLEPEGAARAYLRDLPDAELHLLDGGHWLLETHLEEVSALLRRFLSTHHGR